MNFFQRLFFGKRYSGITNIDEQVRYAIMTVIFWVGATFLFVFGFIVLSEMGVGLRIFIDFGISFLCMISLFLIRKNKQMIGALVGMVPFGSFCVYLAYITNGADMVSLWIFAYPMLAIFLCEQVVGSILSLLVFVGVLVVLYVPGVSLQRVAVSGSIRYVAVYLLVFILTMVYEQIRIRKEKKLASLTKELVQQKNTVEIMKDNVSLGMFLLDKDGFIQPHYSKNLPDVLSCVDDLRGKYFIDLLSRSLSPLEQNYLKDYFDMIFEKSHKPTLLESINPIHELQYKAGAQEKTLLCRFALIDDEKSPFLLGTIEDVTKQKVLERQIQEQEAVRQADMKNLFDVIQIDPFVFNDFIEDTEEEFQNINELLKDQKISKKEVVIKFYQGVHAIKANATILGLEDFSQKLHQFEDKIKEISKKEDISFDDMLKLTIGFDVLLQEKDKLQKIIHKINTFKTNNKIDTIFIETLTRATEKVAASLFKQVNLETSIEDGALEICPRKAVKDILLQFIRNSIYHGIELPHDREEVGKNTAGLISISIKKAADRIEVVYDDDGVGLDFTVLARKLEQTKPGEQFTNKQLLQAIFSPEFSTAGEESMYAGRGVGLSFVKDTVKKHHGTITVKNQQGKGLGFVLSFPTTSA